MCFIFPTWTHEHDIFLTRQQVFEDLVDCLISWIASTFAWMISRHVEVISWKFTDVFSKSVTILHQTIVNGRFLSSWFWVNCRSRKIWQIDAHGLDRKQKTWSTNEIKALFLRKESGCCEMTDETTHCREVGMILISKNFRSVVCTRRVDSGGFDIVIFCLFLPSPRPYWNPKPKTMCPMTPQTLSRPFFWNPAGDFVTKKKIMLFCPKINMVVLHIVEGQWPRPTCHKEHVIWVSVDGHVQSMQRWMNWSSKMKCCRNSKWNWTKHVRSDRH